jgi:hypothetical protein
MGHRHAKQGIVAASFELMNPVRARPNARVHSAMGTRPQELVASKERLMPLDHGESIHSKRWSSRIS